MLIIWHWYVILDTIPDTWYLTTVLDMFLLNTWYLIPDIWHLTINMLSLDTWHMPSLGTDTFTWYCDTWLDTITPGTCITLHIHDYHFTGTWHYYYIVTRYLVLLNSCTSELLYTWTPKRGDSWYYTPVDPCNWITMNIGITVNTLWTLSLDNL